MKKDERPLEELSAGETWQKIAEVFIAQGEVFALRNFLLSHCPFATAQIQNSAPGGRGCSPTDVAIELIRKHVPKEGGDG